MTLHLGKGVTSDTHIIYYQGVEIGAIADISTYKQGYLKADVSSMLLRIFFNRSKFVWHKKGIYFDESIYEIEKDPYEYLTLLKRVNINIRNKLYFFTFNNFVIRCKNQKQKFNCHFKDTKTREMGNLTFDDKFNMINYADDNMIIKIIE